MNIFKKVQIIMGYRDFFDYRISYTKKKMVFPTILNKYYIKTIFFFCLAGKTTVLRVYKVYRDKKNPDSMADCCNIILQEN